MTEIKDAAALAHLEARMINTFGVGQLEYDASAARPVPTAYFNAALRITDASGIVPLLNRWDSERRKSNAGKKPVIPLRALVVLYLLNMQMGHGVTYFELALTLTHRFTSEHFATLGIQPGAETKHIWYRRVSETTYRLIALMNPRPTPLRKVLDAIAFDLLRAEMARPSAIKLAERNQNRLDQFCNLLVEASLRFLPKEIWDQYRGNIAIDATKSPIRGPRNSSSSVGGRGNPDPLAGRYRREGNHDGMGAATDQAAYELETAVMIWNKPGDNAAFPTLVSAISCHNPGKLVGHAAELVRRQKNLGFDRFIVVVDRAYNGESVDTFHMPVARLGADVVFDYKKTDLGLQFHYKDLILVDGSWYVGWMPEGLITVTKEFVDAETEIARAESILYHAEHRNLKIGLTLAETDEEAKAEIRAAGVIAEVKETFPTFDQRLAMREQYRMIPKGHRDHDGYQRFTYPPLNKMVRKPPHPLTTTSITIPPMLPFNEAVAGGEASARKPRGEGSRKSHSKPQPIKFAQLHPYKGPEWRGHFGMRNLVEASNYLLKTAPHGDIENTSKRSGRGYAAVYLALTFAVVASNLKRIATFFVKEAERLELAVKKQRARRRKDDLGRPLPKPALTAPPGP